MSQNLQTGYKTKHWLPWGEMSGPHPQPWSRAAGSKPQAIPFSSAGGKELLGFGVLLPMSRRGELLSEKSLIMLLDTGQGTGSVCHHWTPRITLLGSPYFVTSHYGKKTNFPHCLKKFSWSFVIFTAQIITTDRNPPSYYLLDGFNKFGYLLCKPKMYSRS